MRKSSTTMHRRTILRGLGALGASAALGGCGLLSSAHDKPIKVGILHSLSGTMAMSERAVVDSTLLGLEEINAQGGLLGRPVQPVIKDGNSDWPTFARLAQELIVKDRVSTVFGCWTSASRKTVRPIFERENHLLFYPVQYEGLETSPNIIYTGAAPNQQIVPAVAWSFEHIGKRFFLVGSDYVFPRTANAIIRDYLAALGGTVVGEEYLLLGEKNVSHVIERIADASPDVIVNSINGDTNIAFFRALRQRGITPRQVPTMSLSIAEPELHSLHVANLEGDYAVWNYFQSLPSAENGSFVSSFRQRYGRDRVLGDPLEAAYFGTKLWAQAVMDAGTDDVHAIRRTIRRQSYLAPEGIVYIDPESLHTWKNVRVGRIRSDGQFDIVWDSKEPVRPEPFPLTRRREQWEAFLTDLYQSWGGQWSRAA